MSLTGLIRRIVPPLLLDCVSHGLRRRGAGGHWSGVYRTYRDVPSAGPGFEDPRWLRGSRSRMVQLMRTVKECGSVPAAPESEASLLPLLAAVVGQTSGRVRILDFGGGLGISYPPVVTALVQCDAVEYHVLETPSLCNAGTRLFEHDARIQFHARLPSPAPAVDIVYLSSALQYVEDYAGLLRELAACQPAYFLFAKLSAGDFPTFATAQRNLAGSVLPYWFLNVDELAGHMAANGYTLVFKQLLQPELASQSLPEPYRPRYTCNLLFSRG
jgi:putative methyltransferase (TIGR04325 family)